MNVSNKIVKIHFHIIRDTGGAGGLNQAEVDNVLDLIQTDFSNHSICFLEIGRSFIDSDTYSNFGTDPGDNFTQLVNENRQNDAINIYLLPENAWGETGRADGIPSNALVIDGSLAQTSVTSHEIGHCLGLYHTHSGRGCGDFENCEENIDGSNCTTCGDLVCDTPADPCLVGFVDFLCNYTGGGGFTPDAINNMSYTTPDCMDRFTIGQRNRFHTMINNSQILQDVVIHEISGPNTICTTATYDLQGVPASGVTVTWTASPSNIFSNSSGVGPTANLSLVNPSTVSGTATLTYSIQGTGCPNMEITKQIQVGPEYPDFDFYYFPTCVSPNQVITVVANITQVDYDWTVNGGTILSGQGTQSIDIMVGGGGNIAVHCYVSNGAELCEGPRGTISLYPMPCFSRENNKVTAYPNPVREILYLKSNTEENFTGEIVFVDSSNNLIKSVSANGCEVAIDVSGLKIGVYNVLYTIGDRYHVKRIKIE